MKAVFYVDRNTLSYFGTNSQQVFSLNFGPDTVNDMEVIDPKRLSAVFQEFVKTHKLKSASSVLVFASTTYFQKDLPATMPPNEKEKVKEVFLENIPFNKILSQVFVSGDKTRFIVINKELLVAMQKALIEQQFPVTAITPAFCLFADQQVTFNAQVGEQILKRFNSLSQTTFPLVEEVRPLDSFEKDYGPKKKSPNTRLYLLIGVFVLLFGVLIAVYLAMKPAQTVTRSYAPNSVDSVSPVISTADSPTVLPTIPTIQSKTKTELTLRVVNASGVSGEAERVKTRLSEASFEDIVTGSAPIQEGDGTMILFRPDVSRADREEIITMIKSLGKNPIVKENPEISEDVLIAILRPTLDNPESDATSSGNLDE